MAKIAGVAKESFPGERRVALVPASVAELKKAGLEIIVEKGAGSRAGYKDEDYGSRGAQLVDDTDTVFKKADLVLQVRSMGSNPVSGGRERDLLREGQVVVGLCDPLGTPGPLQEVARRGISVFAMELIPRITRAQSMDALSSMASLVGYKAVLLAAQHLPRIFPMMMTAAGTIKPAKVLVVGAGVAGLQAIATAKRLGAAVSAYDVRPVVKTEVESLGARFVELALETSDAQDKGGYAKALGDEFYQKQRQLLGRVVAESDVVITTAAIPGRQAPLLVTKDAVRSMAPGSVVIDLAAERGGNVEPSQPDQEVIENGVLVLGPTNLVSDVAYHASQMYARNMTTFVKHLLKDGEVRFDVQDEIINDTLAVHGGAVRNPKVLELLGAGKQG